jgi:transcriptional regulator with XRE-family HTH domain
MSELGNLLKSLRGNESQREVAIGSELSIRTVQRAEDGDEIQLATVVALSHYFNLTRAELAALLVAWIKLQLGEYMCLVELRAKVAGKAPAITEADRFFEMFRKIPLRYQRELMRAASREQVLRSIVPLNELYDSLKKENA